MEWATKIQAEKFRWHNSQWLEIVTQHQLEDQRYEEVDQDGFISPHDMLLQMPDDYADAYPELYNEDEVYSPDAAIANGFHPGFVDERHDPYRLEERMAGEDQDFLEQQYGRMLARGPYVGYEHVPPSSPYRS